MNGSGECFPGPMDRMISSSHAITWSILQFSVKEQIQANTKESKQAQFQLMGGEVLLVG